MELEVIWKASETQATEKQQLKCSNWNEVTKMYQLKHSNWNMVTETRQPKCKQVDAQIINFNNFSVIYIN